MESDSAQSFGKQVEIPLERVRWSYYQMLQWPRLLWLIDSVLLLKISKESKKDL